MKRRYFVYSLLSFTMVAGVQADWSVEAGPWIRRGMRVSVQGGSRAAESGIPVQPAGTRERALQVDAPFADPDPGAQILREFSDGFVGPSGFPLFFGMGQTQFFGYQRADQHDAAAGTLTFHQNFSREEIRERTASTLRATGNGGWEDRKKMDGAGLQVRLGRSLYAGEAWVLSAHMQLGWLGGLSETLSGQPQYFQTFSETRQRQSLLETQTRAFVYDTFGNPAFPGAPYAMLDPEGIGPLISDRPVLSVPLDTTQVQASETLGQREITGYSQVQLRSEADLFVLGLAPRAQVDLGSAVSLYVQAGPTLNLLDVRLRREEWFTTSGGQRLGSWQDRHNGQSWLWGASTRFGLIWQTREQLSLSLAGSYEWVQTTRMSLGPDTVRYDLSGYQIELSLGWLFGGR